MSTASRTAASRVAAGAQLLGGAVGVVFRRSALFRSRSQHGRLGAKSTDRIAGTLITDAANRRYWSPVLCGVCTQEQRDNREFFLKGTYFLSTRRFGSHQMAMGLDSFNDKRFVNNHQSGSDYIVANAPAIVRPAVGQDPVIYPQFLANTIIRWRPILVESQGNNFRTHSLFYNDSWAVSSA